MTEARIACALLAAGGSRRLGRPKQLLSYAGMPLVRVVAQELCASRCTDRAVVLGSASLQIGPSLEQLPITRLENGDWREGMSSSIRVAVRWASALNARALVLCACDQPLLRAAHVDALSAALGSGVGAVASSYADTRGIPVCFERSWFARLLALSGDRGAGALLRGAPDVGAIDWPEGAFDIDTEADAARLTSAVDEGADDS